MGVTFNPFTGNLDSTKNPGGSDTQLQFNDGGAFGGSADLTWDDASKVLAIGGDIDLDNGGAFSTTLQMITATANRVISFPDATGTVALVAGSSGQLLYNSAGANAGLGTLTTDGTNITLAGRFTNSTNGAASAPPSSLTGTWFTGGTATTTKPQLLIEPAGTTSTAWSTSGTGLGVNAPSGFTGNLLDLQVNGVSQARVSSSGLLALAGNAISLSNRTAFYAGGDGFTTTTGGLEIGWGGASGLSVRGATEIRIASTAFLGFGSLTGSPDAGWFRDAANTLAQRNGTNAQVFRLYNTLTGGDVTATGNYERGFLRWNSNVLEVGTEVGSGGGTVRPVRITAATLKLPNLPTYADNAAATGGGLVAGDVYKTATGELRITV